MNRYLCMIATRFGFLDFEVNATDKEDALFVAKQYIERNFNRFSDIYRIDSVKVIKKV